MRVDCQAASSVACLGDLVKCIQLALSFRTAIYTNKNTVVCVCLCVLGTVGQPSPVPHLPASGSEEKEGQSRACLRPAIAAGRTHWDLHMKDAAGLACVR